MPEDSSTPKRPAPFTPADCDLTDFEFMPVMVRRLLKSETWSLGTGEERAAAVALWFESWHQVPAASLPSDDRLLKRLADSDKWAKVKTQALRGWVHCVDDRLYHPVVAQKALEAWIEKLVNSITGATGNAKRWQVEIDTAADVQRLRAAVDMLVALDPKSKVPRKKAVLNILGGSPPDIPPESPPDAPWRSPPDDDELSPPESLGDRKGQGQGQREGLENPSGSTAAKPLGKDRGAKRAPADFAVTAEMEAWARENTPLVDWRHETEQFRDWEFRQLRTDWPATWRSWMRKQQKRHEELGTSARGVRVNGAGSGSVDDWTANAI